MMLSPDGRVRRTLRAAPHALLEAGVPPAALGYLWVIKAPLDAENVHMAGGSYERLAQEREAQNPLPFNTTDIEELSGDPSWFGFSQRDVPRRREGETAVAVLPEATLVGHTDERRNANYGLLDRTGRALGMSEFAVRPFHIPALRRGADSYHAEATWICQRSYHNHSHWLTAHVPKLLLMKERADLGTLVLPKRQTPQMAWTLDRLGIDIRDVPAVDLARPMKFRTLKLYKTDKFRGDLVRRVRDALTGGKGTQKERVYISRARSNGRRLVNEEGLRPVLERFGFRTVFMEDLEIGAQVELMAGAEAILAPHGAGLTNTIFAPSGTAVIEIAARDYPNPNFYALASALGQRYGLVFAETVGEGHLLYRDLKVDVDAVEAALRQALG